jgi:hypothetical protein
VASPWPDPRVAWYADVPGGQHQQRRGHGPHHQRRLPGLQPDELATSNFGFAGDAEYSEQTKAIKLFVKQINDAGGINGRKINPIIVHFDPTNEVEMRALCKHLDRGGPAAFAVLDGIGTGPGTTSCASPRRATPPSSASGRR